jgi:Cu/Ag efflux protein CusF
MRISKAAFVFFVLGTIGCSSKPQPTANSEPQPAASSALAQSTDPAKRYHLEGTVVSIDRQQKRVIVDGKDIPGFMAAMTMPYPVADDETLNRVKPGDQITADVVETGKDFHLDNVVVVKSGAK